MIVLLQKMARVVKKAEKNRNARLADTANAYPEMIAGRYHRFIPDEAILIRLF